MKKVLFSVLILFACSVNAQTDVTLRINHKLGSSDFTLDQVAQNNLGNDFKVTRLEYYLSQVTIVHDGGTETAVPLTVVELVQPGTETATSIPLGSYSVTSIESVKFYIGVQQPENNADPSTYAMSHPLAPKSPSMHWGWTAGYRFLALEGYGGANFSQNFQLHGLDNVNYFEVEADINVVNESGVLVIDIYGDYTRGLENIDVTSGVVSHGATGEAKIALENWRDFVFMNAAVSIEETESFVSWNLFPNPTYGQVSIQFPANTEVMTVQITNVLGEIIKTINVQGMNTKEIEMSESGIFFFNVLNENGVSIDTKRLIVE